MKNRKYKILQGSHYDEEGIEHTPKKNNVVETDLNLVALFGADKFSLLSEDGKEEIVEPDTEEEFEEEEEPEAPIDDPLFFIKPSRRKNFYHVVNSQTGENMTSRPVKKSTAEKKAKQLNG